MASLKEKRLAYLPPILLAISLSGLYFKTIAPGLTWANGGTDGGDLITASFTGGVAHPTGYPLYLLLARLFQFLPKGNLAFRTNLMSAVVTVLGALLVYLVVAGHLRNSGQSHVWAAGLSAGVAFGLAPLIWSQAVITEVYALQACLIALVIYLYLQPTQATMLRQKRLDTLRGLILGLAMGNHITMILLVPVALLAGSIRGRRAIMEPGDGDRRWFGYAQFDLASLLRGSIWFVAGLGVYLILPLRASTHPPVNWGNVISMERLWWLISGGSYPSYYLHASLLEIWDHTQTEAAFLLQQFGIPGLLTGLTGLVIFFAPTRLYLFTIWSAVTSLAFASLYGTADFFVYLVPFCISFAIWIGLGVAGFARLISRRSWFVGWGLGFLLIGYFAVRSVMNAQQVDTSHDLRAESFGREVLTQVPENAMIFAKGDQAVFALWYFHYALGERPDVSVLAADLLHFDWYQETIQSNDPSLVLPGPFPWPETIALANPSRAACYVQYVQHSMIECTSP